MPKSRDKGNREAKKPKASKKPAAADSSFLRPQGSAPASTIKPKPGAK